MKKLILGCVLGTIIGSLATWIMLYPRNAHQTSIKEELPTKKNATHALSTLSILKFDKATQDRMGIKTILVEPKTMPHIIKAYGRVLHPEPLIHVLAQRDAAQATLASSTKDYNRILKLHKIDQNASERALEVAEATLKRDQAQFDVAQANVVAAWGIILANHASLFKVAMLLAKQKATLVRIDLPLGSTLKNRPTGTVIAPLGAQDHRMEAEYLAPATTLDPQLQGQGFLFLIKMQSLPLDTPVIGWLKLSGPEQKGVFVPKEAILHQANKTFVYVQSSGELFERRQLTLLRPMESGWFVSDSLKPKEKIVIAGAQEILSAELMPQQGQEE